jgi:hypothetical protein
VQLKEGTHGYVILSIHPKEETVQLAAAQQVRLYACKYTPKGLCKGIHVNKHVCKGTVRCLFMLKRVTVCAVQICIKVQYCMYFCNYFSMFLMFVGNVLTTSLLVFGAKQGNVLTMSLFLAPSRETF